MNSKNMASIGLLTFVAASVVALAVRGMWQGPAEGPSPDDNARALPVDEPGADEPPSANTVTVYYFHGNTRCATCRAIESYTHEAIQTGFADSLASGAVRWKALNYEASGNERFVDEYEIVAPTVVLSRTGEDGRQANWTDLSQVWNFVDDKPAFVAYVQDEVGSFLEAE
ncbi:MAG: nitrophenyl compound nitroreductase subunit ArsF family protein [Planctomycetota bacterium]